jgi:SPX domain protein involved in polyphosphate accumulation
MKFGQHFHRYQVPEWEPFYVNYDQLKKLFNTTVKQAIQSGTGPNFTGLLDRY